MWQYSFVVDFKPERSYTLTMTEDNPLISLRPATADDMSFIKEHIEKFFLDNEDLDYRQFVVAVEEGKIVGFGRIRPHRSVYELGGIGVVEDRRNRGIGKMIVRHLIKIFPVDDVYLTTDIPQYFERFGFTKVKDPPVELAEKIERLCKLTRCREAGVVMFLERRKSG